MTFYLQTCRFCGATNLDSDVVNGEVLVKYSIRHHAHLRCLVLRRATPNRHLNPPESVARVLDTLHLVQLNRLPVVTTFDDHPRKGVMSELGMSTREFMRYMEERMARPDPEALR